MISTLWMTVIILQTSNNVKKMFPIYGVRAVYQHQICLSANTEQTIRLDCEEQFTGFDQKCGIRIIEPTFKCTLLWMCVPHLHINTVVLREKQRR